MFSTKQLLMASKKFLVDNAPLILTGVGIAGTVTTGVLSARSGFKANTALFEYERVQPAGREVTRAEAFSVTWKLYIPPFVSGVITCGAIGLSAYLNEKRAAALIAAYAVSQHNFEEYKEKVREKFGIKKEAQVRDEIRTDRVQNTPVPANLGPANGRHLCFEAYTGRYFYSSHTDLERACNDVNKQVIDHGYVSLSYFYDLIGLPATASSDNVGWNSDSLMTLEYTSTLNAHDEPVLVVDFGVVPTKSFDASY
jgi:hypothetical protein